MPPVKPITLNARPPQVECIGAVRLTPEAERVVRRLSYKTGLPIRQIVSEIIIQAENLIEINTPARMRMTPWTRPTKED